jgi:hypothetical protein
MIEIGCIKKKRRDSQSFSGLLEVTLRAPKWCMNAEAMNARYSCA